jgi:hypothetical protein
MLLPTHIDMPQILVMLVMSPEGLDFCASGTRFAQAAMSTILRGDMAQAQSNK